MKKLITLTVVVLALFASAAHAAICVKAVDTCGNKSGLNEASEKTRVDRTAPAVVSGRTTVSVVAE